MDALAQLALMTKAKLVFENSGSFLSFPALSPISYTADQLEFGAFAASQTAERLVFSEFARLANAMPNGTIFQPQGDTYLWDIYGQVLKSARLAGGAADPQQDAAYQQAMTLLTTTDADGFKTDSAALRTYKQYRDVWFKAVEDYKIQQCSAQAATDASVQAQWQNVDEPRLRALVDQAASDWASKGTRSAIEQAQQVQQVYESTSPQLIWKEWVSAFNPDLDLLTDPNQGQYALTAFSPSNVFDQDWPTFTLTAPEIATLAVQAPKELKDIFGTGVAASTVESLSFEYRSVGLTRPWFRPGVFDARFWRLPDGATPLSDGAPEPQGCWPAYVTALVLVRKISLTMHTGAAPAPPQQIRALPALAANQILLRQQNELPRMLEARNLPGETPHPTIVNSIGRQHPAMMPMMARAMPSAAFASHPVVVVARSATTPIRMNNPILMQRLHNASFTALPPATGVTAPPAATVPATQPATPAQPPVAPPGNDISILAFICKRLPKTPNPDPALPW